MIMLVTKPLIYNVDTNLWPGITSITLRARQTRSTLRKKKRKKKGIQKANLITFVNMLQSLGRKDTST